MRGLEPPRCRHHRLLRPARLPVPPHPHVQIHYANGLRQCQESAMSGMTQFDVRETTCRGSAGTHFFVALVHRFFGALRAHWEGIRAPSTPVTV